MIDLGTSGAAAGYLYPYHKYKDTVQEDHLRALLDPHAAILLISLPHLVTSMPFSTLENIKILIMFISNNKH